MPHEVTATPMAMMAIEGIDKLAAASAVPTPAHLTVLQLIFILKLCS